MTINDNKALNTILVTGSTGYVGGRLIPQLLSSGYRVRAVGRSVAKIENRPWAKDPQVEVVRADVLDYQSLFSAAKGCSAAFYLVHSMNSRHKDFSVADRKAAQNMAQAASAAGLKRMIYLGGLGVDGKNLSKHLQSRIEVAQILQSGTVPTTVLRAAMILGSGSASFEILRYLVERLPIMITPLWIRNPVQPISIRNVLTYLVGCLENDETVGETFDIGGPDILTYESLMRIYSEEAGLSRRWIIPVSVLSPRLSSYWIHFVTPVPSFIAQPLAEGLRNPVVCRENRIRDMIPQQLLDCRETIRLALGRVRSNCVDTCWNDANASKIPEWLGCGDAQYAGGTLMESSYRIVLDADPSEIWKPISEIGGQNGWYFADSLWKIRGAIDWIFGGVGFRKTLRRSPELQVGDTVDFFRVSGVNKPDFLQLFAEMRIPGEATLEFRIHSLKKGGCELQQISRYLPSGLWGLVYWYLFYPFHQFIFKGMLRKIAQRAKGSIIRGPEPFNSREEQLCETQNFRI